MIDSKNITGIILAGGKSSRMGTDKGFLKLKSKLFTEHIIEAIKPLVSKIIIVSNNTRYDVFGIKRVNDEIINAGPLAGIYSGLKASKTKYNLVLSCDVPLIKTDILKMLINAIEDNIDIIQIESQRQSMPLIALYKKDCETIFHKLLLNNQRRLKYAVNQCHSKTIVLEDAYDLYTININTPKELQNIKLC